jgi:hypothetical protein
MLSETCISPGATATANVEALCGPIELHPPGRPPVVDFNSDAPGCGTSRYHTEPGCPNCHVLGPISWGPTNLALRAQPPRALEFHAKPAGVGSGHSAKSRRTPREQQFAASAPSSLRLTVDSRRRGEIPEMRKPNPKWPSSTGTMCRLRDT